MHSLFNITMVEPIIVKYEPNFSGPERYPETVVMVTREVSHV